MLIALLFSLLSLAKPLPVYPAYLFEKSEKCIPAALVADEKNLFALGGRKNEGLLFALDPMAMKEIWKVNIEKPFSPLLSGNRDLVFLRVRDSETAAPSLRAYRKTDGSLAWAKTGLSFVRYVGNSNLSADKMVRRVGTEAAWDRSLVKLDPTTGEVLAELSDSVELTNASDNNSYLGSIVGYEMEHIVTISPLDGKELGKIKVGFIRPRQTQVSGDLGVVYSELPNRLVGLDLKANKKSWEMPADIVSNIAVDQGSVYFKTGKSLHSHELKSGKQNWKRPLGGALGSALTVHGGKVYVVAQGKLVRFNAVTGEMLDTSVVEGSPKQAHAAGFARIGEFLYLGDSSCRVQKIGL